MAPNLKDYALIGDLRTAALVGVDGAIDWLSLPRFDSPAVFSALLGDTGQGRWILAPVDQTCCSRRRYRTDTLILETDWATADGAVRVTDLMVPRSSRPTVVRMVDGLLGAVVMSTELGPRMGYGRHVPAWYDDDGQLVATAGEEELHLHSDVTLSNERGSCSGTFIVGAGQRVTFTLTYTAGQLQPPAADAAATGDDRRADDASVVHDLEALAQMVAA